MKHILLALTLIAAIACGSDDDETMRYNEVKVVLTNESKTNFICGYQYNHDESDHKMSASFTLETHEADGTLVKSERVVSNEPSFDLKNWAQTFKGRQQYFRVKDLTFKNASPKFDGVLLVMFCSYLTPEITDVAINASTVLTNVTGASDYVESSGLTGTLLVDERYFDGAKTKSTTHPDLAPLNFIGAKAEIIKENLALTHDSEITMFNTVATFSEESYGARDLNKYNFVWTTTINIEGI